MERAGPGCVCTGWTAWRGLGRGVYVRGGQHREGWAGVCMYGVDVCEVLT